MSDFHPLRPYLLRYPYAAISAYVLIVIIFITAIWLSFADIYDRESALSQSSALLNQLETRKLTVPGSQAGLVVTGSPFLEGPTITVAGASLLQRVAGSITRVGGNVLSSQVDLEAVKARNGFVSLIVSCEVDQPNLQKLLYDLEAGMPFLFVEQFVAQAPQTEGGRTRVLLGVSGQWQGAK
jgi:general secretion pathway protein M